MVQATWFASNLGLSLQQERKFHDFMLEFLQVADEERLGVFLEVLYAVWISRNELVFQNTQGTVDQTLRKASLLHPGPAMVPVPTHPARQHPTHWSRPAPGLYKINFDASVTKEGSGGFGFIARDVQAEVLAAACWHYGPVTTPTVAEALSMRWSMTLARDLGFRRVEFESDCLPLVEAWKQNGGCSFLDSIVRDCNFLLSNFEVFSLRFVRRTGNRAANALASLSFSFGEVVWIEEVPSQLIGLVQSDVLASVPSTSP
ncbi:uncharacterized protein LOC130710770 [Lotus japonicus]|uniref:uncharacterized protein LOC130710770 n=1 Tax=Lotus japonicus TaxID=34305 RepID=UPI00258A4978|nr:uncharacterized protein LOC130710770 [Lotus japonicus]